MSRSIFLMVAAFTCRLSCSGSVRGALLPSCSGDSRDSTDGTDGTNGRDGTDGSDSNDDDDNVCPNVREGGPYTFYFVRIQSVKA